MIPSNTSHIANAAPSCRFVTVRLVAQELGVSQQTVRRLIYEGELAAVRLGSLLRVPRAALEEYLEENAFYQVTPRPAPIQAANLAEAGRSG
jgi:excisionase family DNA binding protein